MSRIFLLLILLPLSSVAQKKINLTLFGGFSNYSGDIQEKRFTLDQSKGAFGLGLSYEVMPKLLVRGGLTYGRVGADDKFNSDSMRRDRNLNFQTPVVEASLVGDYSLFDIAAGRRLTPYVFAGLALYGFNPYTFDTTGRKVFLRDLGTEGQGLPQYPDRKKYNLVQVAIPFGVGVRFRITDNTYLGYEIGLRKLFTDYLDDVSISYADELALLSGRGPRSVDLAFRGDELKDRQLQYPDANTKRGGPEFKDWYYFSGLTLSIGLIEETKRLFGGGKSSNRRGSVDCPPGVL